MIKALIHLQDLRRKLYVKGKAEPHWRFWGLYTHVCKKEVLYEAYRLAKRNKGTPGSDGVTFAAIEAGDVDAYLETLRTELINQTYYPMKGRHVNIPKSDGKSTRKLTIPSIKDRIVQGAVKLILEPIFESDFQKGSYGYRPKRQAKEAIHHVSEAIAMRQKTQIIDVDISKFFDNVKHDIMLRKIAQRINDGKVVNHHPI
jgi:RNA-directed DNA polymerase